MLYTEFPRTRVPEFQFRSGERQPFDGHARKKSPRRCNHGNGNGHVDGNASMYGRLSQLYGNVHGMYDAVHEDGQDGYEDDDHVHGLYGNVQDVRRYDDAHVANVRQDVRDVCRNVHHVRNDVRRNEGKRNDDALCGNVQTLRRILLHEREGDESRLVPFNWGQRTLSPAYSQSPTWLCTGLTRMPEI